MSGAWNTADLAAFLAQLKAAQTGVSAEVGLAVTKSGRDVRDDWRSNATATAGKHGKLYPRTIKAYKPSQFVSKVEPDAAMPQGGMSFEFGSANQPPHMDGQKALDANEKSFERGVDAAVAAALRKAGL